MCREFACLDTNSPVTEGEMMIVLRFNPCSRGTLPRCVSRGLRDWARTYLDNLRCRGRDQFQVIYLYIYTQYLPIGTMNLKARSRPSPNLAQRSCWLAPVPLLEWPVMAARDRRTEQRMRCRKRPNGRTTSWSPMKYSTIKRVCFSRSLLIDKL